MAKKKKVNPAKRIRQVQKGGVLLKGVQTHADKKNPSPKKLRQLWRNKGKDGL